MSRGGREKQLRLVRLGRRLARRSHRSIHHMAAGANMHLF